MQKQPFLSREDYEKYKAPPGNATAYPKSSYSATLELYARNLLTSDTWLNQIAANGEIAPELIHRDPKSGAPRFSAALLDDIAEHLAEKGRFNETGFFCKQFGLDAGDYCRAWPDNQPDPSKYERLSLERDAAGIVTIKVETRTVETRRPRFSPKPVTRKESSR